MMEATNKTNLVNALRGQLPDLPETLVPTLSPLENQSEDSKEEQRKAFEICKRAIDSLIDHSIQHY